MSLAIAGRPTNLHLPPDVAAVPVSSDVYGICDRISQVSRRLYIILVTDSKSHTFIIMEKCEDGQDRLVFRVKELDGRVIKRLEEMMSLPLEVRIAKLEKDAYRYREEAEEAAFEELYDRLGGPMWSQLEHDGFIQRNKSYPKRGIKATSVK